MDNKKRLEDAATAYVQTQGLKALSFRTLADEVGIKSSSVHYYFPEKSDLAEVLISRYRETLFQSLDKIAAQNTSLRKKISAFCALFESVSKQNKVCLCGMLAAEVEHLSDDNHSMLTKVFNDMESWLTKLLEAHRDQIKSDFSPTKLSKAMVSGIEGAILIDRVMGNNRRLKAHKEFIISHVS